MVDNSQSGSTCYEIKNFRVELLKNLISDCSGDGQGHFPCLNTHTVNRVLWAGTRGKRLRLPAWGSDDSRFYWGFTIPTRHGKNVTRAGPPLCTKSKNSKEATDCLTEESYYPAKLGFGLRKILALENKLIQNLSSNVKSLNKNRCIKFY